MCQLKRCKIPRRYTPSTWRSSVAAGRLLRRNKVSELKAGARIEYVSELLGLSSIAITRKHYAHFARESLKDAASKLPSFGFVPEGKVAALNPRRPRASGTRRRTLASRIVR
jgi:integrase